MTGVEILAIVEENDGFWGYCRPAQAGEQPHFYSVYVRNTDGTADCVGDFTHHADALAFAAAIERGEVEV
ncbi:MAG: hypothetical protein N2690_05035 [Rhodocyclaceae bacterium]|nr:hypothetical protein [Rhodocyclaceae bacterium]